MNAFIWPVVWIAIFGALVRFGVLAATTAIFCTNVLDVATSMPGSSTSWTALPVWMSMGVILLLAIWGFRQAIAGAGRVLRSEGV